MCPAPGQITVILCVRRAAYVTARKNCCKPICPAPGKIGSDCVLYIICPASVDVTVRKNYRKSIYPAGVLKKVALTSTVRGKYAEILIC